VLVLAVVLSEASSPDKFASTGCDESVVVYVGRSDATFVTDAAIWNAASQAIPAVVAFAKNATGVICAVNAALKQNRNRKAKRFEREEAVMSISVRSGRHDYCGFSDNQDSLVVDVSNLTFINVLPSSGNSLPTAVDVGPGVRLFNLYDTLAKQGIVFYGGTCPTVAVGGFVLGGGFGAGSRLVGLGSDNLIEADIVTVDENQQVILKTIRDTAMLKELNMRFPVDAEEAAADLDLLWALRGGGSGNFGVVTRLRLRVYPLPSITSRLRIDYHSRDATIQALKLFETIAPAAPDGLFSVFSLYTAASAVDFYYPGQSSDLKAASSAESFLSIPGAISIGVDELPFIDAISKISGCSDPSQCRNLAKNWFPDPLNSPLYFEARSQYFNEPLTNSLAALNDLLDTFASAPKNLTVFLLFDAYGGKVNRVPPNATAFPHRRTVHHGQTLVYFSEKTNPGSQLQAQEFLQTVSNIVLPVAGTPGAYRNYPNLLVDNANDRYFLFNLQKLEAVKLRVDSYNFFRYNQSISSSWS